MLNYNFEIKSKFCCIHRRGTGGHVYPDLAVADELREIAKKENKEIQIN